MSALRTPLSRLKTRVDSFLGKGELRAVQARLMSLESHLTALQRNLWVKQYRSVARPVDQRTEFRQHELKSFSQNGEDGILLRIFDAVSCTDRRFFEIGVQDGRECNSANLSINFGWSGVLVEGDPTYAQQARSYYEQHALLRREQVKILHRFVTAGNVDAILAEAELSGEIDLMSIDVDGNDLWLWKAVTRVNPRVVVIEYNAYYSWDKAIAVKYDPQFLRYEKHPSGYYFGASLAALKKLGDIKGYCLVACDSAGVNAFFVRKDVAEGKFRDLSPEEAYYPLASGTRKRLSAAEAYGQVAHLDFETLA
jgi:hypothetical protein